MGTWELRAILEENKGARTSPGRLSLLNHWLKSPTNSLSMMIRRNMLMLLEVTFQINKCLIWLSSCKKQNKTNKQKKSFAVHKDENYLQLVLELENLTEGKIVEQRCNQMQLTLDSFFQRHRKFKQRILNIPCLNTLKVAIISPCV